MINYALTRVAVCIYFVVTFSPFIKPSVTLFTKL